MLPEANTSYLGTPSDPQTTYYKESALNGDDIVYLLSETCKGVDEMGKWMSGIWLQRSSACACALEGEKKKVAEYYIYI